MLYAPASLFPFADSRDNTAEEEEEEANGELLMLVVLLKRLYENHKYMFYEYIGCRSV